MMTTQMPASTDRLVAAVMAQRTWAELEAAMKGGYCPTLYGRTRRERILIRVIKAVGYKAWGNAGRNW